MAELQPWLESHALPEPEAAAGPQTQPSGDIVGLNMTHLGEVQWLTAQPGAWIAALFAGA